jgi:hypothetical protein
MTLLPREARDGLMRAWLEILRERHPGAIWVPVMQEPSTDEKQLGFPSGLSGRPAARVGALAQARS